MGSRKISSRMVQPPARYLAQIFAIAIAKRKLTTKYCNALFGISLFCSNADMNLLLGLSPVLISGYDTVNNKPRRWEVGSRILIILYPIHQSLSIRIRAKTFPGSTRIQGTSLAGLKHDTYQAFQSLQKPSS
jgi:hypothetical protein